MYWSALTSYSWKSRSAPAARRTLIASGTTSLPAPSQGRTAMWLRRCGFLLAQLVALDLAGDRLGQLRHELDQVRELEALQARLAVLLQRCDERIPLLRLRLRDHERLDLREPIDTDADHGAFRHRRMLQQRGLDLDRRDPETADLDHVVASSLVPVEAVLVDAVSVAGEEPLAEDRAFRLLVLRPIEREGAVALDVEITGLALGHRPAFVIEDLQLVARHGLAAGAGLHVVEAVGAVDVQHLSRADSVEDGEAECILPAAPDLGGQRLGGGDAMSDAGQVATLRTLEVQDRVVERGCAEEERWLSLFDRVEDCRGSMPPGVEHRAGAHPIRKGEVVAEPIGVEEARGRERRVLFGDAEDLLGVGDAGVRDVVLQVDDRLRLAGRAGAVEPESHIVPARRSGFDLIPVGDLVGTHHSRLVPRPRHRRRELFLGVGVDDHDPGQRVFDEVVIVLASLEEGIDRYRNRTDTDRAEEGGDPARGVVAGDEDALLAPHAQVDEGAGGAAGQLVEVAVSDVAGGAVDGDLGGAAGGEVALEEVGGDVVPLRQIHHRHLVEQCISKLTGCIPKSNARSYARPRCSSRKGTKPLGAPWRAIVKTLTL